MATVSGPGALRIVASGEKVWHWQMRGRLDRWRAKIRAAAIRTLAQPALGVFLGITIGDRGYLEEDVQDWFMTTGTVHLLSISGSHLGLVAFLVFGLVKRFGVWLPAGVLLAMSRTITPTRLAVLCAWPTVVLYALLAGAEVATIRSLVMVTIALAVVWAGYERRLYHALAAAAMVILLHDPRAMFDLSFQLSFLSMIAIVHLINSRMRAGDGMETRTTRRAVTSWAMNALLFSGAVMLVTWPLVAAYFNQFPWMGIMTNILAIPFTGFVLVPIGLLSAVVVLVMDGELLPFDFLQERLIGWIIHGLRWCAELGIGEWRVAAPSLLSMGVFYITLALVGIQWNSRVVRGCGVAVVMLLLGWWVWSPRLASDEDRWRVTFLDVGQGDSAVVELPDGRTVLIDGGARYERFDMGRGVVAPFLWNRNIRHVDHIIGTHQQLDHVGGLIWVLRHFSVGNYWGTHIDREEAFAVNLKDVLRDRQLVERIAVQGDELLGSGRCHLLVVNQPSDRVDAHSAPSVSGSYLNNHSIVSRLECGAQSVLFMADIEGDGLHELAEAGRRPVTIVKVPHHGARNSLDRDWISQVRPQYAVVSVGAQNPYGHPAQPVIDAYSEAGIPLYRTDRDGAVWVTGRMSTSEIHLHRMADRILRPTKPGFNLWRDESHNWHRVWLHLMDE
jgi:competence protein ComEC